MNLRLRLQKYSNNDTTIDINYSLDILALCAHLIKTNVSNLEETHTLLFNVMF